jgi:periplasmic protein TonB
METKATSEVAKEAPASPPAAPPAATQPGPSAAASPAGHYEGPRINADYLHNPRPEYPHSAKRAGQEGRVLLRVQILADGTAGNVSVAKTSGFETLDEAALAAVRKWKFVPAKRDGNPVESVVNVPINFNLKTE